MKRKLFILAISQLSLCLGTFAQTRVIGKMSGMETDSVTVTVINKTFDKQDRLDKIPVSTTDGSFEYTADFEEARQLLIYPSLKPGQMFKGYIQMYVIPNSEVIITGTMEDYHFDGSQFYKDCNAIMDLRRVYTQRIKALNDEFKKGQADGLDKDSLRNALTPKLESVQKELADFALGYIKDNPLQDASSILLNSASDKQAAYDFLSDKVKNGVMAGYIASVKTKIEHEAKRKEASKLIVAGKMAPDFTLNDINGKPLSLSSLRGKYVVLDFWGSWCSWCIKGMPEMKNYYKKYAGKFEILGIDCNDTEQKWKDAVAKHEIPWLHVYNPRSSSLTAEYAVEGFPTKIIVDPEGKIAKVVIGEDPSFYEYLDSLFK